MKNCINITLALLALYALIYGAFAFIHWEYDPSKWHIITRILCIIIYAFFMYVATEVYEHEKEKHND